MRRTERACEPRHRGGPGGDRSHREIRGRPREGGRGGPIAPLEHRSAPPGSRRSRRRLAGWVSGPPSSEAISSTTPLAARSCAVCSEQDEADRSKLAQPGGRPTRTVRLLHCLGAAARSGEPGRSGVARAVTRPAARRGSPTIDAPPRACPSCLHGTRRPLSPARIRRSASAGTFKPFTRAALPQRSHDDEFVGHEGAWSNVSALCKTERQPEGCSQSRRPR